MRLWLLFSFLGLAACASTFKELGLGEPVTKERCQQLDVRQIGYRDGEQGQRRGNKYDFWLKDCRSIGATLNRDLYNQGYDEGVKLYCSCEKGFGSGVREQFTEMQGQYYTCTRKEYEIFLKGHEAGKKYAKDPTMSKKDGPHKYVYFDEFILPKAKEECAILQVQPASGGAKPEAPTVPATPTDPKTKDSSSSVQDSPQN